MSARDVSVNGDKSRASCLRLIGIGLSSFARCAGGGPAEPYCLVRYGFPRPASDLFG
jgi:hypothetical protein